jgi:hypothetical protein
MSPPVATIDVVVGVRVVAVVAGVVACVVVGIVVGAVTTSKKVPLSPAKRGWEKNNRKNERQIAAQSCCPHQSTGAPVHSARTPVSSFFPPPISKYKMYEPTKRLRCANNRRPKCEQFLGAERSRNYRGTETQCTRGESEYRFVSHLDI